MYYYFYLLIYLFIYKLKKNKGKVGNLRKQSHREAEPARNKEITGSVLLKLLSMVMNDDRRATSSIAHERNSFFQHQNNKQSMIPENQKNITYK